MDDSGDGARSTPDGARSPSASGESPALAQASAAGEIRNDHTLAAGDGARNATLIGIGLTARKPEIARDRLFVAASTVSAIEKARHAVTEPSVRVDMNAPAPRARVSARHGVVPAAKPTKKPLETPTPANRWQVFEDLGLAPKPITKKLQKLVVSSYRLLGFGILSIIVVVLVGYIGTTAFYFMNRTWVTPVALSGTDDKVVALQGQLAAQLNERARLVGDLEQSERAIVAEQAFQLQFAKAIKRDAAGRREALGRVQSLAQVAAATRNEIRSTNGTYSSATVSKMDNDYKLGLINRDAMLAGKYQLAQISNANLSLAERQADFDQRATELASQTQSLDAVLSDKSQSAALSYDVLKIARDYETSKLVVARETSNRDRLKASITRQDQIINGVTRSGYMRAIADNATVALVPYANLKNVEKGTPLYACKLDMVWCHQVGTVIDVLPGEVMVKQPTKDSMVRGQMIEMQMTDAEAAQNEVLFVGSKPLGL